MSADNFVGVRQNKDGTYSVFKYGCMSVLDEDCMYLASEIGEIVPSREAALVRAHDLVRDMYICEYGVIELDPVPDKPCGRCYVCINDRQVVADDIDKCDGCHEPISSSEWRIHTKGGRLSFAVRT